MDLDAFRQLLQCIVVSATEREAARHPGRERQDLAASEAWVELEALSKAERTSLLRQCIRREDGIDEITARFLYAFGAWNPDETLDVVAPLTTEGHTVAWQILSAQLSREIPYIHGRPANPFVPVQQGQIIELREPDVQAIRESLYGQLCRQDLHACQQILDGLTAAPSLELASLLTELVGDVRCDPDVRLIASLYVKALFTNVAPRVPRAELEALAEKVARVVGDSEADWNVRYELAYVFAELAVPQGRIAVQRLLDDTRRTGFGVAYLPQLEELLAVLKPSSASNGTRSLPEVPALEIVACLHQMAGHAERRLYPELAEALGDGGVIRGADGSESVIHYSTEVIEYCLGAIPYFDSEDPLSCGRYVRLLAEAVASRGPAPVAYRCIATGTKRALEREQPHDVLAFVELSERVVADLDSSTASDCIYRLGKAGIDGGQLAERHGQLDLAETLYAAVARLSRDGDPIVEAAALGCLGRLHSIRHGWTKARGFFERSASLLEPHGESEDLATTCMELGAVEMQQGKLDSARGHLQRALSIASRFESATNFTCMPHCLANLAELELRAGHASRSDLLDLVDRGLALAIRRADYNLQSLLLSEKARIQGSLSFEDRFQKAFAAASAGEGEDLWAALDTGIREAEELEHRLEIGEIEVGAPTLWAYVLSSYVDAYTRIEYVLEFEVLRHDVSGRTSPLLRLRMDLIKRLVRLLVRTGDSYWALEFADRAKSRSLLTLCTLCRADILALAEKAGASPRLTAQVREVGRNLGRLAHTDALSGSPEHRALHLALREWAASLPADFRHSFGLGQAEEDYGALQDDLRAWKEFREHLERQVAPGGTDPSKHDARPELSRTHLPEPRPGWLRTRMLPDVAAALAPDERLVEYHLDDHEGYVFVLDPDGDVHVAAVELAPDRLRALVEQVTSDPQCSVSIGPADAGSGFADWTAPLAELYAGLIRPIEPFLQIDAGSTRDDAAAAARLVVVPHGGLCNLPFGILWNDERRRYLLEDFELTTLPNGSFLHILRRQHRELPRPFSFSGMANPTTGMVDLPEAEREIELVLSALRSHTHARNQAKGRELTRQRFLNLCRNADVIHYAGHVVFDPESPLESYIPLAMPSSASPEAEDRLTCAELMAELDMRAYLLVLSGCHSGRSATRGQDEILGFLRAGFFCGALNIVYSVWPLPDTPETVTILRNFYGTLTSSRGMCTHSLREAMLPFRHLHPWLWGGFQVAGVS